MRAVLADTGLVVTVKVAVVAFAATVTVDGTWAAAVLLLDSVTTVPPDAARPLMVTVPVVVVDPVTDAGATETELTAGPLTVKLAFWVDPYVADMVSGVLADTGLLVTVKVAVVALAATVTVAGTCAAALLLLDRVITAPPAGAAPFKVTVPVDELPPVRELGFRLREEATGAVTVRFAFCVEPKVADMTIDVLDATGLVVTVNVAVVAPALTITETGP